MIGRKIISLDTTTSTNNYAAKLLSEGKLSHGTVIMSACQTEGKGQRGAYWQSEPYKNLIFTCFVEYVNLSVEKQAAITHFVCLAIRDFLAENNISSTIKWPNDVLIETKKIAGVLIENHINSRGVVNSIIGIGLNVNQLNFQDLNATSMSKCSGVEYDLNQLVFQLSVALQKRFTCLEQEQFEILKRDYLNHLWLKDVESDFEDEKGIFQGIIRGTDSFGRLLIERNGNLTSYDLKEIKFIARNIFPTCETCN